jgi:3-oxoacyl-[acyl-carrier protein] reductase
MRLKDKRAVITGSTRGIGQAIALAFAREGAHVLLHGRKSDAASAAAASIQALDLPASVILADLAQPQQIQRLVQDAWHTLGQVDVWVNNAGADVLTGGALQLPFAERLQRLLDVDLRATVLCSRWVGQRMLAQGHGQIINVGWDQAYKGGVGTDSGQLFAAAKAGIEGFSKALARSLAPTVRVNCLAPGWIETSWGASVSPELYEHIRQQTPLGRWGTPEDVAATALFLASEEAAFLTGQVLMVNGGVVM